MKPKASPDTTTRTCVAVPCWEVYDEQSAPLYRVPERDYTRTELLNRKGVGFVVPGLMLVDAVDAKETIR